MQEERRYRKVAETQADRDSGVVVVPVGFEMRVYQSQGAKDMEMEGYMRVDNLPERQGGCTCKLCVSGFSPNGAA